MSNHRMLNGKKTRWKGLLEHLLKKVDRYLILSQSSLQFGRGASEIDNASIAGQRVVQIGK